MLQTPINNDLKAAILDAAPMIIAIHDTDNNIVWANKAYLKSVGQSLQDIQGKKCYSVWRLNKHCCHCPVTTVFETGESHEAELTPQNQDDWPDSQGSWLSKAAPLKDAQGRIIGAIETAYEITARKQAEYALKQLNAELEDRIQERNTELTQTTELLRNAFEYSLIGMVLVAAATSLPEIAVATG